MKLYWLLKVIFSRGSVSKILKSLNEEQVQDYLNRALKEDNYELAAYLKHYINMKFKKKLESV